MEVSSGNNNEEDDENKGASSPKEPCTNPYCYCPCHKNNGPPVSPAPPAPPATGGYYETVRHNLLSGRTIRSYISCSPNFVLVFVVC